MGECVGLKVGVQESRVLCCADVVSPACGLGGGRGVEQRTNAGVGRT